MTTITEGHVAITMKIALVYPRSSVPADLDLILTICQALNENDMEPQEVMVLSHEISQNGNQPAWGGRQK
ncbi:MAG TPA: hypothetical protein VI636_09430 [Candidatus Angelobacter sp.]